MKDSHPEKPSGYNAVRQKWGWKKLFSDRDEYQYSPFLPLLIVFLAFVILLVYEISFLRYRALVLTGQNYRLIEMMRKADEQDDDIKGLHTGLQALAPTDPAADRIVKEFFPDIPADSGDAPKTP